MGKEAVRFVKCLGDIAAESGRIPKGADAVGAGAEGETLIYTSSAGLGHLVEAGDAIRCWFGFHGTSTAVWISSSM